MALVSIQFDTSSKEMSCTIDGTPIEDVTSVSLYSKYDDPDEYCVSITTMSEDDATEIRHYHQMAASRRDELGLVPHESLPDFVRTGKEISSVQRAIASYLR